MGDPVVVDDFPNFLDRLFYKNILDSSQIALLSMSSFGEMTESSWSMFKTFKNFGILHLLILSGSQVNQLAHTVRFIVVKFLPRCIKLDKFGVGVVISLFLSYYLVLTKFPPPLFRASIYFVLSYYGSRYSTPFLLFLSFILHLLLIPSHGKELGFVLSWVSFLLLIAVKKSRFSSLNQALILTLSCQLLLVLLRPIFVESLWSVFVWCVANLVFCFLFERIFFKFLSVWIFFALFLSLLGDRFLSSILPFMSFLLSIIIFPVTKLVIVVVEGFRYTF